ncbi:hypothetical protein TNCV_3223101 [Trichonephila clavipes]|nr:hypothetical protein TNCV_3223101 [Trichonephila clavipes]
MPKTKSSCATCHTIHQMKMTDFDMELDLRKKSEENNADGYRLYCWRAENISDPSNLKSTHALNLFAADSHSIAGHDMNTRTRSRESLSCHVIYSQFGLAIHQNDHQARRRFVEWAQNEIAVVPDFHKRILFSDEAHFWLNSYVNKQNCRIWSEANPQVYVETPLHPEKLTVWCALWAGGNLLQKR